MALTGDITAGLLSVMTRVHLFYSADRVPNLFPKKRHEMLEIFPETDVHFV
jgi:hypothetical protein